MKHWPRPGTLLLATFTTTSLLGGAARAQPAPAPPDGTAAPQAAPEPPAPPVPAPAPALPAPPPLSPSPNATTTDDASARFRPAADDELDRRIDERLARRPSAGWKDAFFVQSEDGSSRLKVGGFIQFDGRYFIGDDNDPHVDQFAFRSIRPDLNGTLFDHYDFRILPDFAGGKLVLQEAYTDIRYSNAFKIRVGKFKVPFGLERLQLEVATTFTERGLPTQVAPNRDLGVQIFGELADSIVEYQVGVFNGVADGQSGDGDVSDDKELAARVFVKPFVTTAGPLRGLGVGGAVTYGDKLGTLASPDVALFKTQGQNTFFSYKVGTTLADTAIADGDHFRATVQGYYYVGPVGILAEWVRSRQKVAINGNHERVEVKAWQALAQWVITGEDATFKSVTPRHPFDPAKGQWGAFDVAARIGELTLPGAEVYPLGLADPTKSANQAWSATGGVDWFLNHNIRIALDYDHVWYNRGAKLGNKADEDSIVGRFQTVF